ncbi:peptide-methionine (R)-S-oxide reductase MsrB [Alkalicaulis satelles]|uniref:peptide-methionine (R)-S-oxide reductase n=1 Tax=Alkalicaulis satelles TaxID=2609175 RepID=A0A5M6ZII5_9PROT|nr:peptide-methionine (R)-S-oxide reductase MsrB [Alkalicaulis satelles]KAA5804646.1 peptide-methionine (R)-S-oxide reductase MsrB [Alkalicaulis satelles]
MLTRRSVFAGLGLITAAAPAWARRDDPDLFEHPDITPWGAETIDYAALTEAQWRERLTPDQFRILRREGTERPGSSPLNRETRDGIYVCAGCALPLFSSAAKYESGTGWPSFWAPIEGALNTKIDWRLWTPRTEYHCARCGGHQGHVFEDGPRPTGQRWCNNGLALNFVPRPAQG